MSSARAIFSILLLIGVSVYFFERVSTTISYSDNTYKEIRLEDLHSITSEEPFFLKDFHYHDADFNRLDNRYSKAMLLYTTQSDSVARFGIEVNKKFLLLADIQEQGKILVKPGGSMWKLSTYNGWKLFGYGTMSREELEIFKKQMGEDKFDEGIDRSIMLKYIPSESFSENWKEFTVFSILIIVLLVIAIVSIKQARRSGQF